MTDIYKVKLAQNGDDNAFLELIDGCKEKLYKIAFTYFKNEQDSLDVVSDTVYKAYMQLNKLKKPQYFDSWIIRILINLSIDKLNYNKKIVYIEDYEGVEKIDLNSLEINWQIPNNIDLFNAIDKLDSKLKTIIILKYFEDMTISQISQFLNYPEGTIKVYIQRALKKLKVELKEESF